MFSGSDLRTSYVDPVAANERRDARSEVDRRLLEIGYLHQFGVDLGAVESQESDLEMDERGGHGSARRYKKYFWISGNRSVVLGAIACQRDPSFFPGTH